MRRLPIHSGEAGRGKLAVPMKWECNQNPPKGSEIMSVDVTSDRPLRILGADWSSTAAFDHMSQPAPDLVAPAPRSIATSKRS